MMDHYVGAIYSQQMELHGSNWWFQKSCETHESVCSGHVGQENF